MGRWRVKWLTSRRTMSFICANSLFVCLDVRLLLTGFWCVKWSLANLYMLVSGLRNTRFRHSWSIQLGQMSAPPPIDTSYSKPQHHSYFLIEKWEKGSLIKEYKFSRWIQCMQIEIFSIFCWDYPNLLRKPIIL